MERLSDIAIQAADGFVKIPMFGFIERFNISVSVAILFYYFTEKLRTSGIYWHLSDEEKIEIKLQLVKNTLKKF
ncbi:MAG: hypothetical protein JW731_13250 [Bacteroidales bacterium]|nr:hypothetical protein [Bacteroidales bacterium]